MRKTQTAEKPLWPVLPCFSSDGKILALAGGDLQRMVTFFYDVEAACFLETQAPGYPWEFTGDGTRIIISGGDGVSATLEEWDIMKSRTSWKVDLGIIPDMPTSNAVCVNRNLVIIGWANGSTWIINYQERTVRKGWKVHEGGFGQMSFSPNGCLLLTSLRISVD